MAAYPEVLGSHKRAKEVLSEQIKNKHGIARWMEALGGRPAVKQAMAMATPEEP